MKQSFTVMFGGQAGYGIMSAGAMIAKAAGRNGLWAFVVNEYPSLIKGGLNTCSVTLADRPLITHGHRIDFLCALSQAALDQNCANLNENAAIIYDADSVKLDAVIIPAGVHLYPAQLIGALTGETAKIMVNSAMVGAFCALAGFPVDLIAALMQSGFIKTKSLQPNLDLLQQVYETVCSKYGRSAAGFPLSFQPDGQKKMLINGNDAIAMGALKAGVKFAAGYPMTPGTSVLMYLADYADDYQLVFKQAEDEIAAINMLIGAAFAGVRAIGSTSGGGFALMTEALGFAAQGEVPVVMVNAQRGGPSTGLPTRTAQADLNFVVHASQGEFPRIVVAPGDIEECFTETIRLFDLVERYQVPGVILTDKYLSDCNVIQPYFDDAPLVPDRGRLVDQAWLAANQPYRRYQLTADGISPRAIPGQQGGRHIVTSYTHGEDGFYSSGNHEYAADERQITVNGLDKLFNKVPAILKDIPSIKLHGCQDAQLTIVGWGSTKGAILEALNIVEQAGHRVNFLQVLYPSPFPTEAVAAVLERSKRILLVEGNKTAQLGGMMRAATGFHWDAAYLQYDSRQFNAEDIARKIEEVL